MSAMKKRTIVGVCAQILLACSAGSGIAGAMTTVQEQDGPGSVRVRLAVAPSIEATSTWPRDLRFAVARASDILEPALGRRVEIVGSVHWQPRASATDLLADLFESVARHGADIVLGVMGPALAGPVERPVSAMKKAWGLASYDAAYAIVFASPPLHELGPLVAHELAHLFGTVHRDGSGGVMDRRSLQPTLDPLNHALIQIHRDRVFKAGVFPLRPDRWIEARELYGGARDSAEGSGAAAAALLLARIDLELGAPQEAVVEFERGLDQYPEDHQAWSLLGLAQMQLQSSDEARTAYEEVLQRKPDSLPALINLSRLYLLEDRTAAAIALSARLLKLRPASAEALSNLALAYALRGNHDATRRVLEQMFLGEQLLGAGGPRADSRKIER